MNGLMDRQNGGLIYRQSDSLTNRLLNRQRGKWMDRHRYKNAG